MSQKWDALAGRANTLRLAAITFAVAAAVAALLVIVRYTDSDDSFEPELIDYFSGFAGTALPYLLVAAVQWIGMLVLQAMMPEQDD